jgi:hypothetical protein
VRLPPSRKHFPKALASEAFPRPSSPETIVRGLLRPPRRPLPQSPRRTCIRACLRLIRLRRFLTCRRELRIILI